MQYYAFDYKFDFRENVNSFEYFSKIKIQVFENLKRIVFVFDVVSNEVSRDSIDLNDEVDAKLDDLNDNDNKDSRWT